MKRRDLFTALGALEVGRQGGVKSPADPHELIALQQAELTTRLRRYMGIRGRMAPALSQIVEAYVILANLDEPAYADSPRYFVRGAGTPALAANFSGVSWQGAAARTIIDAVLVSLDTAAGFTIRSNRVGASGTAGFLANRGRDNVNNQLPVTLGSITTQQVGAITGDVLADGSIGATQPLWVPLRYRMGAPSQGLREEVAFWSSLVNVAAHCTFFGREFDE